MSDSPAEPDATRLAALRARLYAPDSTALDRARYDALLAQTQRPAGSAPAVHDECSGTRSPATAPAVITGRSGARRPGWSLVSVLLALAVGGAAGSALSARATKPVPVAHTPIARPGPAATSPVVPTPVAAAPLIGSVAAQNASAAALVKALALKDGDARSLALERVDADEGLRTDADWSSAVGCSQYAGQGDVSIDGSPSGLHTDAGETSIRPTGTRFRLTIHLTRAADWSWIAYGTRTGADSEVLAVGAGATTSGPAQYAEFTERATTVVTAISIVSTGKTPFLWQLASCTPE